MRATARHKESYQNRINCETNIISSAAINAEVNSFLMQEAQKLINTPPLTIIAPNISTQQQAPLQHQPTRQQQAAILQRATQQQQTAMLQQTTLQPPIQQPVTQHPANRQLSHLTNHLQTPNYFGLPQQQNSYYPSSMLNTYNPLPQFHHGYQHMNSWQYPQSFAAPAHVFPPAGVPNAYNNVAFSAAAQAIPRVAPAQPLRLNNTAPTQASSTVVREPYASQPNRKSVTASNDIKLTNSNRDHIAKLPVAFGFWLDDDGSSKKLAKTATNKWLTEGKNAANSKSDKPDGRGKEGAKKRVGETKSKKNSTPEGISVNGSPNSQTPSCSTLKSPKTPAILLSEKAAARLPLGWTSKTFQRTSGKTAGHTDTYWYSPHMNIKFRSIVRCKQFIEILNEPGICGKEPDALKVHKERGHKF
mmetsp:Transcript_25460/g.54786  ORF Transcript_25460/g.54786 Transcript_25460/m.54786 type:complete len:417 (+) Transcript_25460:3-1253(+)